MDGNLPLTFVVLLLLVLCSSFFSASETAFTCLNQVRVKNLANAGNKRAQKVLELVSNYDKLISSILIGNNIVNILSSSLATIAFVALLGSSGVTVSTAVMTVLILLFGEIAPKSLARVNSEKLAFAFYPVMALLVRLFTPLNFVMGRWQRLIGRLAGSAAEQGVTEEELITLVEEAEHGGEIDRSESELIRSAIEFTDQTAEDILTPRVDMAAIELSTPRHEIETVFSDTEFSRLPVYEGSIDNIVGILHEKDFFRASPESAIADIMKRPVCVLPSVHLGVLLRLLQKQQSHMAVVIDEYGGVTGIVTLEDILEELVGEIWDEHDEVTQDISPVGEDRWRVAGSASIDDLAALVGLKKQYESVTVSGWVQEELGRFPKQGERFTCEGLTVTVQRIQKHRVEVVLVEAAGTA